MNFMANTTHNANLRIQWFHKKVIDMSYPNAMRLAERFHISHRQAQRDVDFLHRKLGAPLEYCPEHKGYRYSETFSLPIVITSDNDDSYVTALPGQDELSLFGAEAGVIQMQLAYTATVELGDKLTALELSNYIIARKGENRYACEFHHVDHFLAALLTADADVKLLEPNWLRERLIRAAQRVLQNHTADGK
jgi:predicted DNA-binding transcriptional regulator YafY